MDNEHAAEVCDRLYQLIQELRANRYTYIAMQLANGQLEPSNKDLALAMQVYTETRTWIE